MVSIKQLKLLRESTGVSMSECKKALEEAQGDIEGAKDILRKRGQTLAGKKNQRETSEGIIASYIHPNKKIGVLLDLACESDFVAKSEEFCNLGHEICLQVAAAEPSFVSSEDIPKEFIAREKEIYREQFGTLGKPKSLAEQVIEGKLKKYKEDVSLLSQPWIKDNTKTVQNLLEGCIAKVGENIIVKRFIRYEI